MRSVFDVQVWIDTFGEDQLNLDELQEYLNFVKSHEVSRPENYTEWHHVMPKCIDKSHQYNSQLIELTGADHLRAHLLIVDAFKCNSYRRSLGYAVRQMTRDPLNKRDLTPKEYEEAKKKFSDGVRGTKMSDTTCRRISETLSDGRLKGENHPRYGEHLSDETKRKISEGIQSAWTPEKRKEFSARRTGEGNPCYGKHPKRSPASDEARKNMSIAGKGKVWINNGRTSTKINPDDELPEGYTYGRCKFARSTNGHEGKMWINNGTVNKKIPKDSEVPEGFVRGRLWKIHED